MKRHILNMEPFPSLHFEDGWWEGPIALEAWRQFGKDRPAEITLSVESPDQESMEPPAPAQQEAFRFLLQNAAAIRDAMLNQLLERYEEWRNKWGSELDDAAESMPPVTQTESFRDLISLNIVYICAPEDEERAQVGFSFRCSWDSEHGLGFMTQGTSVLEIGGADVSFVPV